jgi:hypothetical protein
VKSAASPTRGDGGEDEGEEEARAELRRGGGGGGGARQEPEVDEIGQQADLEQLGLNPSVRVVRTPGCRIGYMDILGVSSTGVLTQNNVVKSANLTR